MTKKEYCLTNEPVACHIYYRIQIHGFEYGIEDYVYISRLYQKTVCGKTCVAFHKVKINNDIDGEYIVINEHNFDGRQHKMFLKLDDFVRIDSNWASPISCAELRTML